MGFPPACVEIVKSLSENRIAWWCRCRIYLLYAKMNHHSGIQDFNGSDSYESDKWRLIDGPTLPWGQHGWFRVSYSTILPVRNLNMHCTHFSYSLFLALLRPLQSIINPSILSRSHWQSCYQPFKAANGESFVISLISKPIFIQLFPGHTIKHQGYGSDLRRKDHVVGFDILHSVNMVSWNLCEYTSHLHFSAHISLYFLDLCMQLQIPSN